MEMSDKQYRADLHVWIFFCGLSGLPWLIVWADAVHGIRPTDLLIAIDYQAFAVAWLVSFRIVITPEELIFRSLFRGKQSIKHGEIKKVRLAWKFWRTRKSPSRL